MAYIRYIADSELAPEDRVADHDHIIQVHAVHPAVMRHHYNLYVEVMRRPSPLSRVQREMIAVVVSGINGCHY